MLRDSVSQMRMFEEEAFSLVAIFAEKLDHFLTRQISTNSWFCEVRDVLVLIINIIDYYRPWDQTNWG